MRPPLIALLSLLLIAPAPRADEPEPFSDAIFFEKAAMGGKFEVDAGMLALLRSNNAEVKHLVEEILRDHNAANDKLAKLAPRKALTIPKALDAPHKALYQSLSKMENLPFDTAYLKDQFARHKKTLALFEREVKEGKDADLKAFAAATLPKLKAHTQRIEKVAGEIGIKP